MIQISQAHLRVAAGTHPGMRGKENEDRFAVSAYQTNSTPSLPSVFAILADGIGGHLAGELAAEMAVESISKAIGSSDAAQPIEYLRQSIVHASMEIFQHSLNQPELEGMGTTCACAWVIGDRLYTASVGDSRIYLIRQNTIQQISIDHTWIQEALDYGLITPEQARNHPNIHVIRRFLGSRQPVEPDTRLRLSPGEENAQSEANQGLQLHSKDTIVLCSDGLTDLVAESEILANFQKDGLQDSIERLIRIANQRGGHDNITLVALQVPEPPDAPQEREIINKPRRNKLLTISLVIVLIVALLAGLAWASQKVLKRGETQLTDTAPAAGQLTQPVSSIPPTALPSATPYRPTAIQTEVPSTMPPLTSTSLPPAATFTPWPTNTSIP